MFRLASLSVLALGTLHWLSAQLASGLEGAIRVGAGVTPPRLLHKIEPEYSPVARADHIQGSVVLQLAVDEQGRAVGITVISPLGFGLDERAIAAVEQWRFAAGTKDGKPVKILATVEVNFRFPQIWFDEKAERQRTSFNVALQTLQRPDSTPKAIDRAVMTIQDLARQKYPPAVYLLGIWEIQGEHVAQDPSDGIALVQKAAAKNYGPALYEVAIRQIEGRDLPKDSESGLAKMRNASILGSGQAQFYLGNIYEKGNGVEVDADRARRYFRLCAAQGVAQCQFRLANLLFRAADRPERDYIQAVAWYELAGNQDLAEAKEIAAREEAKLTPAQTNWVNTLKAQLVRK